jgi:hypothetical protein
MFSLFSSAPKLIKPRALQDFAEALPFLAISLIMIQAPIHHA